MTRAHGLVRPDDALQFAQKIESTGVRRPGHRGTVTLVHRHVVTHHTHGADDDVRYVCGLHETRDPALEIGYLLGTGAKNRGEAHCFGGRHLTLERDAACTDGADVPDELIEQEAVLNEHLLAEHDLLLEEGERDVHALRVVLSDDLVQLPRGFVHRRVLEWVETARPPQPVHPR